MKAFPRVREDALITCYACRGLLLNHRESGYPPGCGAKVAECPKCRIKVWYDLKVPISVPIGQQDR